MVSIYWKRRVARLNDFFKILKMIEQLGWPTLKQQRAEAKVVMMYKILDNFIFDNNYYTWGHSLKLDSDTHALPCCCQTFSAGHCKVLIINNNNAE